MSKVLMQGLLVTLLRSAVLVLLGVVYFMVTIWIIKVGARWAGFSGVSGDWVVLTTGIISAATILGTALKRQ